MPNKVLANDWLESGKKHLEVAEILFKNGHYTDIVGIELQHSYETKNEKCETINNKGLKNKIYDKMNTEERHTIFRQIMWDYNISADEVEEVLKGKRNAIGHYNKQAIFVKLLESYSWFTIVQLFSLDELRQLLTDNVIKKLRFKSLRTKYEFVQKRLQSLVPVAE